MATEVSKVMNPKEKIFLLVQKKKENEEAAQVKKKNRLKILRAMLAVRRRKLKNGF